MKTALHSVCEPYVNWALIFWTLNVHHIFICIAKRSERTLGVQCLAFVNSSDSCPHYGLSAKCNLVTLASSSNEAAIYSKLSQDLISAKI